MQGGNTPGPVKAGEPIGSARQEPDRIQGTQRGKEPLRATGHRPTIKEEKFMSINELNATAKELLSVRSMIAELEAEAEAMTDRLKAAMVERGEETLQGDGWKATWKNVTSSRFDSKKFKADHSELYAQYSKKTTTTRFCVGA